MKSLKYVIFSSLVLMAFKTGDNKSQYVIPSGARTVCTSDIDNDQDWDIITGHNVPWGYTNISFSVLENIDDGIFAVKDTSKSFCGYQENIFTILVNDDSLPDLVVFHSDFTNELQRYIRVYYNDSGNFNNFTDFNLNSDATFGYINYGKVNDDDFDDLVVISNSGFFWGILYNDGAGGFTDPQFYDLDWPPTDITCGDLDGDGRDDVLVAGYKLGVYYSNETGLIYDSLGLHQGLVQITDFDNDDDMDIVGLSGLPTTIVTFIENSGNNNFLTHEPIYYSPHCGQFVVSDLNNDSLPDLIATSMNSGVYILYNEGNFQITNPVFISVPLVGYNVLNTYSADLDHNGFNDLIITQTNANFINLLFNDGNGNFVENPITIIQTPNSEPQTPNLTCFPNPFHTSTQFTFNLKDESNVAITIYDHSGKKVNIINPGLMSPGNHSVEFNSANLPSGIYFYSLEVNGIKTDTKKMTLMR